MACPFFLPIEKLENGAWQHASRLPLGCGWSGQCTAPEHVGEVPTVEELQEFCNLGYAQGCRRLPRERTWDSVRFAARSTGNGGEDGLARRIQVRYICEREHRPAEHGFLEFDMTESRWAKRHSDDRVQRLAECFLISYVAGKKNHEVRQAGAN